MCRAEPTATGDAGVVSPVWIAPVVVAYLLGTVPSAHLVAGRRGLDPTKAGSGNPGATNVYRVAGRRAGLVVFAADAGKGALATGLGLLVGGRTLGVACWAAATVGHVLPLTRRFRGGKGVATAGGGSWVVFPVVALCCSVLFALVARMTGKASLGSLAIAVVLPVLVAVFGVRPVRCWYRSALPGWSWSATRETSDGCSRGPRTPGAPGSDRRAVGILAP